MRTVFEAGVATGVKGHAPSAQEEDHSDVRGEGIVVVNAFPVPPAGRGIQGRAASLAVADMALRGDRPRR